MDGQSTAAALTHECFRRLTERQLRGRCATRDRPVTSAHAKTLPNSSRTESASVCSTGSPGGERASCLQDHSQASTMSLLVLCMNATTASRSPSGTLNVSRVALTCPMKADQSLSLIRMPLCEVPMSRPV